MGVLSFSQWRPIVLAGLGGLAISANGQNVLWSGDLADGTVLPARSMVVITGNTRVPPGATVTLGAGTVIKANGSLGLTVEGALLAQGTSAEPVIFTEIADDSAGGDTDNNGPTVGFPGRWGQVRFTAGSGVSVLQNVEFRYGGAGASAEVTVEGGSVRFDQCTFRFSRADGMRINGAKPVISECNFLGNWASAMSMDLSSNPDISGGLAATNAINGLSLDAGSLPVDGVWDDPDVVYYLRGTVTVPAGRNLTIGAGQVIKLWSQSLLVSGSMVASGTDGQPIVFSSVRDDSIGGDTNNDRDSVGFNGDWGRVEFTAPSSGNELAHVEFRYGSAGSAAEVIVDHAPARFLSCVFRHSRADGLRIITSNPTISAGNFYGNWGSALSMDLSSNPLIQGVQTSGNGVNALSLDAGTLPTDGVWDDREVVYHLRGAVTVPAGKKLTIGAGQVIKTWSQGGLSVAGVLRALGTAGQRIVFTSLRDDAISGDTNNDGLSYGFNGDWSRVEFTSASEKSELAHVEFRLGGLGSAAQVSVAGSPVEFTGCLFRYSRADGLRITSSNPLVTGGEFSENWGSALSMNLAANPKVERISVAKNGVNGLSVDEGTLPNDNSWDDPDVVYYLRGDVTVPTGHLLNIAPGQVIKVWGRMVSIAGTLRALGTASEPIVFTSLRDDSIGGDTNNDRTSVGFNGDWGRLDFGPTSVDNDLAYVQFRYGAAGSSAIVEAHGAPVRFTRCEFRHSRQDGLRILSSAAVVAHCFFHDNWAAALSQDLAAGPVITKPEIRANGVNALSVDGGTLSADASWDDPDVVYNLKDTVTVPSGRKLTIAAGQIFKLWGRTLSVAGTLHALGTPTRPIIFSSLRDDSIAGDTNNDGPGVGFNGDWGRLEFTSTSVDNQLAHLEFRCGGGSGSTGTIVFSGGQANNLNACLIRLSASHAVVANSGAHLAIVNSILARNWAAGLRAESGAVVDAFNNTIDSNDRGVWTDAAAVTLVNNFITSNRSAGVTLTGTATVTARYNGFHNARNFDGLPAVTGQNGNMDADPLYEDATTLNFMLKPGSPGVDAGLGDDAPTVDFLEQLRVDDPEHANTGGGNPSYVDIGAIELDRWLSEIDAPRRSGLIVLGDTLRFTGTGQALDGTAGFSWNFGNGQASLLEDPGLVTFRSLGPRTITFTAIGADGMPDPNPARMDLTVVEATGPLPDLEVAQIEPPAQLAVGQPIDIIYQVRNRGQADLTGKTWTDAVYLSADPYLDSADVKLDSQSVSTAAPAGGVYMNTLHVTINSSQLQSGVLYLIVSVDDEWVLLEERQLNNELALPTDVAIPELRSGIPHAAQFTRSGAGQFYRFEVGAGENLHVRLDDLNDRGVNEIYLRRGQLPSREAFDERFETVASADHELIIPAPTPGIWYLLAFGASVPDSGEYTIQVDKAALTLGEFFPNRSGQLDGVQFRVRGAGFVPGAKVELVGANGVSYPAAAVSVDSFSWLDLKLNLSAIAPGAYRLRVQAGDATATLENALTVTAGGQSRLETQLIVPDAVGYHQLATLYVEYRNTGTAAMPAPLIAVSGIQNGQERALLTLDAARITTGLWVAGLPEGFSHTVHFLASGEIPGWLHPGESGRIPVYYAGWLQPWDLSYPPINFNLLATTTESQMAIDWGELESTLKPGAIPADAWQVVAANLRAEIGSTWGSLMTALSQDAAYLGQIGQRVSDATTLFGFELAQADGSFPFHRLEREVDAVALTPGLPLVLERTFPALISARFETGPLGRGWKHCWETAAKVATDGSVVLRTRAGGISIFQPDLRGGYVSASGDYGSLTKLGDGRFRLQDPDGITSLYRSDGRLESIEDTNGRKISLEYSGTLLAKLRHSGGSEFQFAYNAAGRMVRLTDEHGQVTTFTYDAEEEHLINIQYPQGRSVTYRYGATGAQIHALLEKNDTEQGNHYYTYDDRGRVAGVRFGSDSPEITVDYKPGGEVLMTAGASSGTFYFDHEGRLVKVRDANGLVRQTEYDTQGRLTELIDPLGRRISARYDSRGHLISVTDVLGRTTSLAYDANGKLSAIADPNGQVVRYEIDTHGNLVKIIQPDATAESYVHNADGQLTQWTRPNGAMIHFTYDSAGRVSKIQADDGTAYTYGYDSQGYLTNTTDVTGTTQYTYNASNLVSRVVFPGGRFLSFTYDSLGRRSTMEDQTGFTIQYQYNGTGRLQRLEDAQGAILVEYSYDGAGRLDRVDKGNGTFTTYAYGAGGRMTGITNGNAAAETLSQFNWVYDDFGRISALDSHQGHWAYTYDAAGQLTAARFISSLPDLPDQDLKFEYDPAGNRTRMVSQGSETRYTVNALNQYTQAGDEQIAYDLQGGLASRMKGNQSWRYSYNALGRITRVETPEATWLYQYDALGNRVAAMRGDQTQEFVFDPFSAGNLVGEYQEGALLAHYAHGVGLVGRFDAAGSAHFYDFDQIGSTAGVTDASGAYANEYAYDPFGAPMAAREAIPNPFQYVGQYGVTTDGNGLYHMRARDYLPETGRFLNRDPFGPRGGINPYTYVSNDPVSMIDPSGEDEDVPGFDVFFDGSGQSQVLYLFRNAYERGWGRFFDAMREHGLMSDEDQGYLDRGWQSFEGVLELQNVYNWLDDAEGKLFEWGRDVSTDLSVSFATTEESVTTWLGNAWTGIKRDVSNWYNQEVPRRVELVTQWFSAMLPRVRSTIDDALRWIGNTWNSVVAWALDPNEKTAPAGGGANHYVMADGMLTYRIDFENEAQATAPAQYVSIVDDLHSDLDWTTFELGEFAFGDQFIPVPAGNRNYSIDQPITYLGQQLLVQVRAELNLESGRLQVAFSTIDPATGLPPSVLLGFLPPEDGTGRGQGYISYRIRPKAGLPSGTQIFNVARINFDFTQTIATDQVDPHDPSKGIDPAKQARNTLDAAAPVSQVDPLPAISPLANFTVSWEAGDEANGSGIFGVDILVSTNGGPWTIWKAMASGTNAVFSGSPGNSYAFYSIAYDYAGHVELAPEIADATTTVSGNAGVQIGITRRADGVLTLTWASVSGQRYTLLEAPTVDGPWTTVSGQGDIPGTGADIVYQTDPIGHANFYMLEIRN